VEAWRCILEEKTKFYTEKGNETALSIVEDEEKKLTEISAKLKINHVYTDSESTFFFKRSKIYICTSYFYF
jgi:hypothetical protein